MNMWISELENWIESRKKYFEENEIAWNVEDTSGATDDQSVRLDLETKAHLARIVVWEKGYCVLEVIEFDSEKLILNKNIEIQQKTELETEFQGLLDRLA